jgi:hypothetical protein
MEDVWSASKFLSAKLRKTKVVFSYVWTGKGKFLRERFCGLARSVM